MPVWRRGGTGPPWWWRPWISPLAKLDDWWHRPRPVKPAGEIMRTRSQAAGECDECDSYTTNQVVNGCLLCDRCMALWPDPLGICHGGHDADDR